ncbi:MAG: hypothetical protein LC114_21060 [Bryobacterales bacterium]|nr:hypothetical protein [Bryobacterales bacterium]
MNNCETYWFSMILVVVLDGAIFFNAHRFVRTAEEEDRLSGGRPSMRERQISMVRRAAGISIVAVVVMFFYLLSQQGCFA